ncbi:MAG TPA: hypothetical protein PLV09_05945, partial [Candidatus Omnitrophota bacterium]|nr:hypothetical protein [Candidatus Omnitrophota bacterium]
MCISCRWAGTSLSRRYWIRPGSRRPEIVFLKNIPIKIPSDLVLSRLKYAKYKTKADGRILSFIAGKMDEGHSLVETKAVFAVFDITVKGGAVRFGSSGPRIKSESLSKHLKGAAKAALFACTIGKGLGEKVNDYVKRGEIASATVLDTVGSEAAEALADEIDRVVTKNARAEGFSTVTRFSPGYGDWSVFDQGKVLKALKASRIGIKATK